MNDGELVYKASSPFPSCLRVPLTKDNLFCREQPEWRQPVALPAQDLRRNALLVAEDLLSFRDSAKNIVVERVSQFGLSFRLLKKKQARPGIRGGQQRIGGLVHGVVRRIVFLSSFIDEACVCVGHAPPSVSNIESG